jgi:glutathione S-transferase
MALALYGHPFSSFTQKALIALYENALPFEFRQLGPDQPEHEAELKRSSPMGKFPMLADGERRIVEASLIIEYLQLDHPGPVRLIPDDAAEALEVRFLDRFFDLYVMDAMQVAVNAALKFVPMTPEDVLAHSAA